MTFATSSPAASAPAGQGSTPPVCQNCTTSTTPLWRRDEAGSVLCNACGLFLKLHGRPRPISLKTDVIKSRNRVKNAGQPLKKKASLFDGLPVTHPAPRSENGTPPPGHRANASARSVSPQSSRSGTPLPPPSHIFDHALLNHSGSDSPTLPSLSSLNQTSPPPYHHQQPNTLTMDQLIAENNKLKTRVAELELVNDLFRGRVGELESSEASAKRAEICRREVETHLRQSLEGCTKREEDLKRRLEECERELAIYRRGGSPSGGEERQRKKVRVSDLTQ